MPRTKGSKNRAGVSIPAPPEGSTPAGTSSADVQRLSRTLGISVEAVEAMMAAQGAGLESSSRNSRRSSSSAAPQAPVQAGAGSSAWADFMEEADSSPSTATGTKRSRSSTKEESKETISTEPEINREYILPIQPSVYNDGKLFPSYLLTQTGTLDTTVVGRKKMPDDPRVVDFNTPTLLCPTSVFRKGVSYVATSSSSCHSIAITSEGIPYGWGRNEAGQLGLGSENPAPCVFSPVKLDGGWGLNKIVSASTGKSHSVLVDETGAVYAAGMNKNGQCGVNSCTESCMSFRKCFIVGGGEDEGEKKSKKQKGEEESDAPKIVQVSCGENFSLLLDAQGYIYTAGSAEFGQLGNGSTGEHFITANKIAFEDSTKFVQRRLFVWRPYDQDKIERVSSADTEKPPLVDSYKIRIGSISCGKNHAMAVEAPFKKGSTGGAARVFSWGGGNYGTLGHKIQGDEYLPRLIESLQGPMFESNQPVSACAGSSCGIVLSERGHCFYWGRFRSAGEATMRPAVIEALANNGHEVKSLSAGAGMVMFGTANGNTISWGQGPHGELGYGKGGKKSSAKPQFLGGIDKCLTMQIACGYGHALMLIRDEDDEDKSASKDLPKVEKNDLQVYDAMMSGATTPGKSKKKKK
mmetsp:Transcript_7313/g.9125  ORF Transcript_7313/g.9125 Transcript_7313/m.9125 type:complete len:636 (-) Transcript_7313:231-2138(-)